MKPKKTIVHSELIVTGADKSVRLILSCGHRIRRPACNTQIIDGRVEFGCRKILCRHCPQV